MEATRSQTRTANHERPGPRFAACSAAEMQKTPPVRRQCWRWMRAGACLIALAQQAVALPAAALLTYRMLEEDAE